MICTPLTEGILRPSAALPCLWLWIEDPTFHRFNRVISACFWSCPGTTEGEEPGWRTGSNSIIYLLEPQPDTICNCVVQIVLESKSQMLSFGFGRVVHIRDWGWVIICWLTSCENNALATSFHVINKLDLRSWGPTYSVFLTVCSKRTPSCF